MPGTVDTGDTNIKKKTQQKNHSVLSLTVKRSRSNLEIEKGFLSLVGSEYSVEKDSQPDWVWWPPISDGCQDVKPRVEACTFTLCIFHRPGLMGILSLLFQKPLIFFLLHYAPVLQSNHCTFMEDPVQEDSSWVKTL